VTRSPLALALALALASLRSARADDTHLTREQCTKQKVDVRPGAPLGGDAHALPSTPGGIDAPIPWSELAIDGKFVDDAATVRALLSPTIQRFRTTLTPARFGELALAIAKFGYQLVGHETREVAGGVVLALNIAPLPIVRHVYVDVHQSFFDKLLDEELRRRMQLRVGVYMPWEPTARECARLEEQARLEEYLHDEGYFEAKVAIAVKLDGNVATMSVKAELGAEYHIGKIDIPNSVQLAVQAADIRTLFVHRACAFGTHVCVGGAKRFTRAQYQLDLQAVTDLFHKHQHPAVRVQTDFDPKTSFDRRTKTVNFTLSIDQRRRLDVVFEGNDKDALPDLTLKEHLTFDKAASTDDVEVAESAKALTDFLQDKGYFDARVTSIPRLRFPEMDRIIFRIETGPIRATVDVSFVQPDGSAPKVIARDKLAGIAATKKKAGLLGATRPTTAAQLEADRERIRQAYKRVGYRDARVAVAVATDPRALATNDPAFVAALLGANVGEDLYVRFTIEEGAPTVLARVELAIDSDPRHELCDGVLRQLNDLYAEKLETGVPKPRVQRTADPSTCAAIITDATYREDDLSATPDRLRDWLFNKGRPRTTVRLDVAADGAHRVIARYQLGHVAPVRFGSVVVRGNFRTRSRIVRGELRFGELLTQDALAETARRLRATGLFTAVNIDVPDLDAGGDVVNAVVHVEERYDYNAEIDLEGGYSSYTSFYVQPHLIDKNILGTSLALDVNGTIGQKLNGVEATFSIPRMLLPAEFRADFTALYREQDTPAFGRVTTEGISVALSRAWLRPRLGKRQARVITFAPRYDWRVRTRNVDALRPIGADQDQSQVTVSTTTGQTGVSIEWDQRVDRKGNLSPLLPEDGFHLFASAALAGTFFGGQDDFVKISVSGSKFFAIGENLLLRGDARYDEGFPFHGAVLLPEVERFFAGGDTTVRGYDDDKMATQIVQVGVLPVASLSQIRVQAAGGNIRALASVDLQYRVFKTAYGSFATAVFCDAGLITNAWSTVTSSDVKPSIGMAIFRFITPLGTFAVERAIPLRPQLGDDPLGRWHISLAARAQF
jgi:outer membrane protein assembly factor BamA